MDPNDIVRRLQKATPSSVRAAGRRAVFAGSAPLRSAGRLPRRLVTLDDLLSAHLTLGVPARVELVEHEPVDPTLACSAMTLEPRTVRTLYIDVETSGADGWRFDNNHLVGPRNELVYEPNLAPVDVPAMLRPLSDDVLELDGSVAYLSNTWPDNFSHWMLLTLPLLERYRADLGGNPDFVYVGTPFTGWQRETLRTAGFADSQMITVPCRSNRMLTTIMARYGRGIDRQAMTFARRLYGAEQRSEGHRRLFLARGNATTRRFLNESDCVAALAPLGFEFVSTAGLSVDQESELFADAAIVVTCHGSAATNLVFAPSDATLVELMPPGFDDDSNVVFMELMAAIGGRHAVLAGEPIAQHRKPVDADLLVDVDRLVSLMTSVVDELERSRHSGGTP